jgi:hypothetical protein
VLVEAHGTAVRIRLPLTDVTGEVRAKEKSADSLDLPIATTKTALDKNHFLEWQIGYDRPTTNIPSTVPTIRFTRNGETKSGHAPSKILLESVRLGVLSTNYLLRELAALKTIPPAEFEESQPMQVETETNLVTGGFQHAIQRVPRSTKSTPHGSAQIQLKQKQRAVGYQAMVYACVPMIEVLMMAGEPRKPDPAQSKETVYYDFNHENAALRLDIIHAFGMASPPHHDDMRQFLGKILEAVR